MGDTMEVHRRNEAGRRILYNVPFQSPRKLPKTQISPRGGMPSTSQVWLHMPEEFHGISERS